MKILNMDNALLIKAEDFIVAGIYSNKDNDNYPVVIRVYYGKDRSFTMNYKTVKNAQEVIKDIYEQLKKFNVIDMNKIQEDLDKIIVT